MNNPLFMGSATRAQREKALFMLAKANVACWEYDVAQDVSTCIIHNAHSDCEPSPVKDPAEYYISSGDVHPDSEDALRSLYRRIKNGEAEGETDIRVLAQNGVSYMNQRIFFSTSFDEGGAPVSAICVEKNMDDVFCANARYERVHEQYSSLEQDCLFNWRVNLTRMTLEYSHSREDTNATLSSIEDFRSGSLRRLSLHLPENERPVFIQLLNPKRMKEAFARGKSEARAEFTWRRENGETLCVSITVRMLDDPKTGELMAFAYVRDVSEKVFWRNALNEGVKMTCDFISVLDTVTGINRRLNTNSSSVFPPDNIPHDYERAIRRFADTGVPEAEREGTLEAMHIESIVAGLKDSECYRHMGHIISNTGALESKEWIYRFFDDERRNVIYVRRDASRP